jgi:hypothetical protein
MRFNNAYVVFISHADRIAENEYWLRHVCQSVRMEQFGINRTDFQKV